MENKEYLNEENYQKNNVKVRKIGKILLIVGIVVFILGIALMVFGGTRMGNSMIGGMGSIDSGSTDIVQKTASGTFL